MDYCCAPCIIGLLEKAVQMSLSPCADCDSRLAHPPVLILYWRITHRVGATPTIAVGRPRAGSGKQVFLSNYVEGDRGRRKTRLTRFLGGLLVGERHFQIFETGKLSIQG